MDLEFRVKVRSDGYIDPQTIHNNVRDSVETYGVEYFGREGETVSEITVTAAPSNPGPLTPDVHIRPENGEPG